MFEPDVQGPGGHGGHRASLLLGKVSLLIHKDLPEGGEDGAVIIVFPILMKEFVMDLLPANLLFCLHLLLFLSTSATSRGSAATGHFGGAL